MIDMSINPKLEKFLVMMREHIAYEETYIMPTIEQRLSNDDMKYLNEEYKAVEDKASLGNLAVGMAIRALFRLLRQFPHIRIYLLSR